MGEQETCYDAARNAYDAHVKSTKMLVEKWKIEYTALEKIICYVNVWFAKDNQSTVAGGEDTDVERSRLKECKSLKRQLWDTSEMVLADSSFTMTRKAQRKKEKLGR